jgi:hypothetical protein
MGENSYILFLFQKYKFALVTKYAQNNVLADKHSVLYINCIYFTSISAHLPKKKMFGLSEFFSVMGPERPENKETLIFNSFAKKMENSKKNPKIDSPGQSCVLITHFTHR